MVPALCLLNQCWWSWALTLCLVSGVTQLTGGVHPDDAIMANQAQHCINVQFCMALVSVAGCFRMPIRMLFCKCVCRVSPVLNRLLSISYLQVIGTLPGFH